MKIYLSENRIVLSIISLAFVYTFLYFPLLGWNAYVLSSIFCMAIVITYTLTNIDTVIRLKKYWYLNILACVYYLSVLISRTVNGQLSVFAFVTLTFNCFIFPFIELQREKGHSNFLYKSFLVIYGICLVFNDILMVVFPGRFYGDGFSKNFLIGNKFHVSYNHMVFLFLYCVLFSTVKKYSKWIPFMFILTACICFYVDCRTAMLGTFVAFIVYKSPDLVFKKLNTKSVVLFAVILCAMFVFFSQIAKLPSVKYFITEVLGRDVTLTGRQQIFEVLPKVIRRKPWLGYGSSSKIISHYTGAYDAQNGFFDLVVSNGIPSAVIYVILLVSLVKKSSAASSKILLGGIYAYIVMSMVEITYSSTLLLLGILLFTESLAYKNNDVRLVDVNSSVRVQIW